MKKLIIAALVLSLGGCIREHVQITNIQKVFPEGEVRSIGGGKKRTQGFVVRKPNGEVWFVDMMNEQVYDYYILFSANK